MPHLALLPALVGAAAGAAKGALIDKPKENRQRALAAETQRWSPWTGIQSQPIQEGGLFNGMLQGGMTGANLGQNIASTEAANKLQGKWGDLLTQQIAQGGGMAPQAPISDFQNAWPGGPGMPGMTRRSGWMQ